MHHLLKTIRIYAWSRYLQSSYLSGQHARSSSFFFFFFFYVSRHRKAELLRKWIPLVLQGKFRLIGCLVKANALVLENIASSLSSQLIVLVFTKQPSAERYLAKQRTFTKIHPWQSLMLVKLQAFTGATTGSVL